jgi:hypothetical protein
MSNLQKRVTIVVSLLCFLSGTLLFIHQDILYHLPSEYRTWMISHGVFGQLFLILFGMSINGHVMYFIKQKKQFRWGLVFLASILVSIVSVFFLFYGGLETRDIAHVVHVFIGFLIMVSLVGHIYRGKIYRAMLKPKYNY